MESLICTVKSATSEGSRTTCSVFMLSDPTDLAGKVLSQYKDAVKVGEWRVESYAKELVLERVSGDQDVELADYLYGEVVVIAPPPSRTQIGHYLVFEGKNWKLAAEKKWRERQIDIAGFQPVGETAIKGKPYRILKGGDVFAAVPSSASSTPEGP